MLSLINGNSTRNGGYAIFLSGDELNEIRPLIHDIDHLDSGNVIEFSNLAFRDLCDALVDYEITSPSKAITKKLKETKPPLMKIKDNVVAPKFKLNPRDYQIEAIKYGLNKERYLLGDEMGLGKTGTTIFASEILKAYYGFKHALIVCGINGAKYNWHMIEIPKFSYESSHIIGSRINKKGRLVVGSIKERIEDLDTPHDEFYLIINVESLRNKEVLERLKQKIVSGEIGFMAIDEIHLVSGRSSEQGKAIQHLKPKFRVGLTGTPIHNRPLELYNLLVWLGYEHRNFEDFADEYTIKIPTLIERGENSIEFFKYVYRDLSMLHNRLKEIMLRRSVDILKLPTPVFVDEYVELDKTQLKLYNSFRDDALKTASFKSLLSLNEVVTNPGVVFIKARQIVSCPHIFGVNRDAKLERTIEIVEEAFSEGKSLVIFAWFNETIDQYNRILYDRFSKEYGEDSILCVDKKTKNAQETITQFQNSKKPTLLIGTIGKLGVAFTITKADIVIFVDKHVIWSDYKQAYMRVWRQGQTKTVVVINIMAKDTVDERLEFLIGVGKSHSEQVVDGKSSNEYLNQVYGKLEDLL